MLTCCVSFFRFLLCLCFVCVRVCERWSSETTSCVFRAPKTTKSDYNCDIKNVLSFTVSGRISERFRMLLIGWIIVPYLWTDYISCCIKLGCLALGDQVTLAMFCIYSFIIFTIKIVIIITYLIKCEIRKNWIVVILVSTRRASYILSVLLDFKF